MNVLMTPRERRKYIGWTISARLGRWLAWFGWIMLIAYFLMSMADIAIGHALGLASAAMISFKLSEKNDHYP